MTLRINEDRFEALREFLAGRGFDFEDRPHQVFLARGPDVVVSLYENGKVVLGGSDDLHKREIEWFLEQQLDARGTGQKGSAPAAVYTGTRVGLDEAGKGDYFGPLVVAGVLVTQDQADRLASEGVQDSKRMNDDRVRRAADTIRDVVGRVHVATVLLRPERYNELYEEVGNLNHLLGWAHATALEELLEAEPACGLAIVDKFGNESLIVDRLGDRGRDVELVQVPRAESDVAVAAASVVARAVFLKELEDLGDEYGVDLPKGATHVVDAAKRLVASEGPEVLDKVAKVHFRTTRQVLDRS